jgi:raffinose/stachyose/melibiose transport system substrate-binding protein
MKKYLSILCAVLMVASVMSGCAKTGTTVGKTTITIMQSKTEIQTDFQKAVDDYNSSQSNVTVKLLGTSGDNYPTVLQSQFSATPAKAPTIFTISGPDAAKFQEFMAPLDSSKAAGLIVSNFKDEVSKDEKVYGLPMAVEGYGLIYNKTMFQQANVDPSKITSVEALVDACKSLSKVSGVTHPLAYAKDNYFVFIHPFNWAFAVSNDYANQIKQLDNGQITLADIPSVKQYAKELDEIKPYTNSALDSYDDQVAGFASGKFAIIHQGDWVQTVLDQDKVNFDYDMMPYPTGGNTKLAVGLANAWRVNKYATAAQQKAAINFLDWLLTSDKGQSYNADTFQFISALKGMKTPSGQLAKDVSTYVQNNQTVPWVYNTDFPNGIDVDGASLMQKYYANAITSDQLLTQLTQVWVQDSKK